MDALSHGAAALNAIDVLDAQRELARHASVELSPRQLGSTGPLTDYLPRGTRVYIPSIPGTAWRETVAASQRLGAEGMLPVPHLPARLMRSAQQLDDRLGKLAEAGVRELLLVAGDHARAAGPYHDTLDVLESGKLVEHGFRRVGVAAYPEGHPLATRGDLEAALSHKIAYAHATGTEMWIVTQFTFAVRARHRVAKDDTRARLPAAGPCRPARPGPATHLVGLCRALRRARIRAGADAATQRDTVAEELVAG